MAQSTVKWIARLPVASLDLLGCRNEPIVVPKLQAAVSAEDPMISIVGRLLIAAFYNFHDLSPCIASVVILAAFGRYVFDSKRVQVTNSNPFKKTKIGRVAF